ncbi:MAG: flagellar biosynthesis protein FlhA [Micavibrio aeruginosavorus]|uniref:Flagellar biosynthesis protein FlhA n=1 Tax=Micavibrio aeruginosavorus TaxID=349221 RepID=A0A7T5UGH6_9BACT|nr:MAG: flagellar biosynthesis protein FlhA [Micavibrio aeruginosavorus]
MSDTSAPKLPSTSLASAKGALRNVFRGDIAFAFGIILILMFMLIPMPTWLVDAGLSVSITFSILILMTVLFIKGPLEFSTFPTILLVSTALRLGLNIASTRLILENGHTGTDAAGHVIEAFGSFIIRENYIIGGIVFAILVIVNFVVITKGSGRIAEVAARFTLDAMPGKQMAIDADLSAGLIDENQAKERRSKLEQESSFFGAMDGAAKFVRGDAIAGLLIVFINVVAGIVIGAAMHDLTLAEAATNYTTLTIGDGLVTQIPALIISVAAGLLVSKAGVEGAAETVVFEQFSRHPKALYMSSAAMFAIGLLPAIPAAPFFLLGALTAGAGWTISKRQKLAADQKMETEKKATKAAAVAEEPISKALAMDTIRLELGYGLLPLVQGEGGNKLTDQIKGLRRQLAEDMGYILPAVRIQDNLQLPASSYVVRIKEIEAGRGDVRPGMMMCMDPNGDAITLPGENTVEPTFGLPAMWIDEQYREEAHFRGYTVVDAPTVITTHITEIIKDNMSDLLSYTETQRLLDELPSAYQKLVADVIPSKISVTGLQRILQNLVSERVSIRDLPSILEGVSEAIVYTKHPLYVTEHVRSRLARQLCDAHVGPGGFVPLATLSPDWEQAFADALIGDGEEKQLAMPPSQLQGFITAVRDAFDKFGQMGEAPVMLTSPGIRPYVRSVIERFRPQTIVMSQNEIHPKAKIRTLGQI